MIPIILLTIISLHGLASGAPYLGNTLYHQLAQPQFYVNPSPLLYHSFPQHQLYNIPPQQYLLPTHHQQYTISPNHQENSINDVGVAEINQFHSDDGQGRVLYGFHGHNQARMEARDPQGRVRGSYSYVDPNGHLVRMDYWDDGSGFQARGNNIPKIAYDIPGYTPEVQAAREQHFKLFQQILLSSVHTQPPYKVEGNDYPYVERPDGGVSSPSSSVDDDDTVEVGMSDANMDDDQPLYPSYPGPMRAPQNFDTRPNYQFQDEEDLESIALDNPEFRDSGRSGKSLGDSKQESSNQEDKVQQPAKKDMTTEQTKKKQEEKKDESIKDNTKKTDENSNESKKEEVTVKDGNNGKHSGFSYNFQYTLGSPSKLQITPNFQKFSSVAASETSNQRTSVHSVHPLPIRTVTGIAQGPSAVHDVQMTPYQASVHQQVGQMILKSFPAPAGAVHDAQVPRRTEHVETKH